MNKYLLLSLLLTLPLALMGDDIGSWRIYNASPTIDRLQCHAGRLYAITGSSLCSFSADSLDADYMQLNRMTGLSGSTVSDMLALPDAGRLAIAYDDSYIDIMDSLGNVTGIADLAEKSLAGDKTITSLVACGHELYVSGAFGFFVVDVDACIIPRSYLTSFAVTFAFRYGDALYRSSQRHGLQRGSLSDNLSDVSVWQQVSDIDFQQALVFTCDGREFCWLLATDGQLYQLSADGTLTQPFPDHRYVQLYPFVKGTVLLPGQDQVLYDANAATGQMAHLQGAPFGYARQYAPLGNEQGDFFYLPQSNLIYRASNPQWDASLNLSFDSDWTHTLSADGIVTSFLGEMQVTPDGIVGISRRSYIQGYEAAHSLSGVLTTFHPDTEEFDNVTAREITPSLTSNASFQGLTGLAVDPLHEQRYAISTGMNGIYIIDHDTLLCRYDESNTDGGVEAFSTSFRSTRVNAVTYDDAGRLWFANSVQDTVLRCLLPDGTFIKYPNAGMAQVAEARRILISQHDDYQLKWVLNDYGYQKSCVGIYYDGGTPDVKSDDQATYFRRLIDQDNNEYLPYYIHDLCEDNDGKVWVLTNLGPFVIDDPGTTFDYAQQNSGLGKVRRVKIPRNDGTNLADYLMESTTCTCMAIDNFNRKWIGTSGAGLYLMSDDCITTIQHFTADNSPLLTDYILALCYDAETGILYISCEGGMLTYQTDAIEGEEDFSHVYCYPNPVRPEYDGDLRIMGLMNDSQVSITTTTGELICRLRSDGATATWDLRNASGARVDPGIYVIHCVDADGKKGQICKFLVL